MNQSLLYELDQVMPQAQATGLFSSLCTVQQCSNTVDPATGQVDLTDTGFADIAGAVDIPCQRAPQSILRIGANTAETPVMSAETNPFHLLLDDYYPQIPEALDSVAQMRAIIDGVQHDILGVESDSQKQMTRLFVVQVGV